MGVVIYDLIYPKGSAAAGGCGYPVAPPTLIAPFQEKHVM